MASITLSNSLISFVLCCKVMLLVMITETPAEKKQYDYKIHHIINSSPSLILGASKVALDVDDTLLIEKTQNINS